MYRRNFKFKVSCTTVCSFETKVGKFEARFFSEQQVWTIPKHHASCSVTLATEKDKTLPLKKTLELGVCVKENDKI